MKFHRLYLNAIELSYILWLCFIFHSCLIFIIFFPWGHTNFVAFLGLHTSSNLCFKNCPWWSVMSHYNFGSAWWSAMSLHNFCSLFKKKRFWTSMLLQTSSWSHVLTNGFVFAQPNNHLHSFSPKRSACLAHPPPFYGFLCKETGMTVQSDT